MLSYVNKTRKPCFRGLNYVWLLWSWHMCLGCGLLMSSKVVYQEHRDQMESWLCIIHNRESEADCSAYTQCTTWQVWIRYCVLSNRLLDLWKSKYAILNIFIRRCLLQGDHFNLPFYHLSQSQKCYGILTLVTSDKYRLSKVFHRELSIILSHVSVTSNDRWVVIVKWSVPYYYC